MAGQNGAAKQSANNQKKTTKVVNEPGAEKLFVVREPFMSNGKSYLGYKLYVKIRGRESRVDLMPPNAGRGKKDGGGYEVLDIVFGEAETAEFVREFEAYTDQTTDARKTRILYSIQNIDENTGVKYSNPVVFERPSDGGLLTTFFAEHDAVVAKKAAEEATSTE
jgi:hypothetical protein